MRAFGSPGPGPRVAVTVLGLFGLAERVLLWLIYRPIPYGDTHGAYMRLAGALANSLLREYDGTRVPGYPGFLALMGRDPERIWLAQLCLGWLLSLVLFWIGWKASGSARVGLALGLLYDLIPGQFLFESNLLSETLTSFLIGSSLALLLSLQREMLRSRPLERFAGLALGVIASLAGLVRPLFFLLAPWLLPFVWSAGRGRETRQLSLLRRWIPTDQLRRRAARSVLYALPPLLLLGGWIGWVYSSYGMLAPTTMGGYHMVQHTGGFFELLPDEEAVIRDTYLRYREARIAARGNQTNTIWEAIPELTQVTGLSFFDLSREMQRLSWTLIREHPERYLANAAEGWLAFWIAPPYWDPSALDLAWTRESVQALAVAGRALSVAANVLFVSGSAAWVASRKLRERLDLDAHVLASGGLIWISSVAQTLVDHGDNARFLVPLQMLVFYVLIRGLVGLRSASAKGRVS